MKILENRKTKNIILMAMIAIFIVIYRLFIYKKALSLSDGICTSFSIILLSVSYLFLGFRKQINNILTKDFVRVVITCVLLYFIGIYGVGLVVGFLTNSYSLKPLTILNNSFYTFVMIIACEVFRYIFISSNKDNKLDVVVMTILLALFEANLFIKYDSFGDLESAFKFITLTGLPIFMKHFMCTYCAYHTDYKAPIIYRIIMDTYFYFVPIQPDLGDYLISILTLFLPFLILLYLSRIVDKYKRIKNQDYSVKMFKVSDFAVAALLIVFGCVVLGIGPYKLVGIETGSMTPALRIGDAVIIDKNCDRDKLKVDDIIAYVNHDNVLVVHRIIQVNSDGTFVTKGDYNNAADSGFVNKSQVKGKVSFKIPLIAYPAIKFKQK